ncbi:PH-like domain-containing protein [Oerskovia turbata]
MNLPLPVAVGIWVFIGLVLLGIVFVGLKRLTTRTAQTVPAPPAVPDGDLGEVLAGPVDMIYVSSTLAGDWLARVGAHRLGFRSNATVTVRRAGVLIERQGAPDLFVAASALEAVSLAPGMAGKFVGEDGLVVLTWTVPAAGAAPATRLDTGLRTPLAPERATLLNAVRELVPAADSAPNDDSKEPQQ